MARSAKGGGGGGHGGAGQDRWLLTYADLITLLLVFFIVMYSISKVDQKKYAAVAQMFATAFGGGNMIVNTGMGTGDGTNLPSELEIQKQIETIGKYKDALEGVGQELQSDFARDGRFAVFLSERGLTISLAGSAAFDSGKADLKPEFVPLLDAIALKLAAVPNDISIEGHTDSDPIHNALFPSNWELSAARAQTVRQYLQSRGINQQRMIVVGYGETRALYTNETAEGKAKNRRVDVVVLRNKAEIDLGRELNQEKR